MNMPKNWAIEFEVDDDQKCDKKYLRKLRKQLYKKVDKFIETIKILNE